MCLSYRASIIPPCAPLNVHLELNMYRTSARRGKFLSPTDLFWFYNQVRNKGPWDFKQQGEQFADFGNFHYGAVGTALGLSNQILLRAAGWAQTQAGTTLNTFGNWWDEAPYGDDPTDQIFIANGIEFALRKGYRP